MPPLEGIGIVTTISSIEDDSSNEDDKEERQLQRGGVRFADDSKLKNFEPTIHINDYSNEEKSAAWYVFSDLKRFKKDRRETMKRINEGKPLCPNSWCTTGLLTSETKRKREESISQSLEAVMKEQERQNMYGYRNDEMIAAAYGVFTLPSIERAQDVVLSEGDDDDECRDDTPMEEAVWTRI